VLHDAMLFRLRVRRAFCLVVLQILAGPHFYRSFLNSSRPAGLRILRAVVSTRNEGQNTQMAPILSAVVHTADADESSDDEYDGDVSGSPEAASKWLRKACVHEKSEGSVDTIASFLGKLDAVVLAKAVGQGNKNGKAALHFASQLRGDDVELVALLLNAGADVNAATRRGHTPLVFAAGRGHSKIVQLLLRRGANPRVIVVTGDTPVSMGRARLDAETFALLEAAEKSFDGPWEDSRNASDALQAQAEHMKTCPHWRRKLQQKEAAAQEAQREQLSADIAARISKILDGSLNRTEFVTVVAETCGTRRGRSILDDALQKAIGVSLRTKSVTLIGLLQLLDEEALGRALHQIGHHDRRPLRTILSALLKELETSPFWLDSIAVTDITAAASLHLAMEVIRFKVQFTTDEDRFAVEKLWEKLQAWAQLSNSYTPEVSLAAGTSLSRRQGGPAVTELLQRLRWACSMQAVTPMWAQMMENVVEEAFRKQKSSLLYDAVKTSVMMPPWVLEQLSGNGKIPTSKAVCNGYAAVNKSKKSLSVSASEYTLPVQHDWISDSVGLASARRILESCFETQKVFVGVDTEWGVCGKTPSVVQIAIHEHAWVIDTATPTAETRAFFQWLFQSDSASFLGFAFAPDADKLAELMKDGQNDATVQIEVIDLQKLAMQHMRSKGHTPGLKSVAATWLGVHLDKTEQCSDWDRRPLSESQMRYAASDASVLLEIAAAMGLVAATG